MKNSPLLHHIHYTYTKKISLEKILSSTNYLLKLTQKIKNDTVSRRVWHLKNHEVFAFFSSKFQFALLLLLLFENVNYGEEGGGERERKREIENSLCFLNQYRVGNCVKKVKNFKFLRHNSYNFLLFQVFHFLQPSFPSTHWIEDRTNTMTCKSPSSINTFENLDFAILSIIS